MTFDPCETYEEHPNWCGRFDDDDFISTTNCCACGGGLIIPRESLSVVGIITFFVLLFFCVA